MTRKEFSNSLIECRERAGCGKNELCRRTGFTFNQLQRLENASNNFSIDNVLIYLHAIEYGLYLKQEKSREFYFDNRKSYAQYFKKVRKKSGLSQRKIAEQSGVTKPTIENIEFARANTAIDLILKCMEVLGCEITIKPINDQQ